MVIKIGIEICVKIGGAPWLPTIPFEDIMTIGYDVSTDSVDKRISFGALVATMNLQEGAHFFSAVNINTDSNVFNTEFSLNVVKALRAYQKLYNVLPKKIIIYRGGISDGEIKPLLKIEVETLETTLKAIYEQMKQKLEILFIVVNKRVATRIFYGGNNPPAGTVVDDVITSPGRYVPLRIYFKSFISNQILMIEISHYPFSVSISI